MTTSIKARLNKINRHNEQIQNKSPFFVKEISIRNQNKKDVDVYQGVAGVKNDKIIQKLSKCSR